MSDPNFYRKYECNIDCYKLKASKNLRCTQCSLGDATADSLLLNKFCLGPANVCMYSGSSPVGTTHTITATALPLLNNRHCSGTIELYLDNDLYVNVSMGAVVKAGGTILQALIYQRVGNFTSVDMNPSGNTIVVTCNPQATCRWVFRGI